ncbi:NAD(P)/FAD-dependent oxidoreductase [Leptolyngbya sp. KIOST-1]|uniref:NAD(P)/FAD-dependent oxidoreductase n=1 Tax=Leptolyngbya sp. KIOST-1 TaxID=1229172 RepID=UPI000564A1E9|nr:FAD-dependent oxidoreductase [Leptolyngbya sp. KIOST-1]
MAEVVVIGAGPSGLTAAQALHRAGYSVEVVDKSRGLGGRMATRRIGKTAVDHGCRYLQPFTDVEPSPIVDLVKAGVLCLWQPERFELGATGKLAAAPIDTGYTAPHYSAPQGMSAIAKAMAQGLTIRRHWRATGLTPQPPGWRIEGEGLDPSGEPQAQALEAKAVVIAIPAPQAAAILKPAAQNRAALQELVHRLQPVDFEAVITVMAGYGLGATAPLLGQKGTAGWMVTGKNHPTLRWVGLDSSKRTDPEEAVVVCHSTPAFAARALELTDLEPAGNTLLAEATSLGAWVGSPAWMQVHRWRYGFVKRDLGSPILTSPSLPTLVGCGDWCSGGNVEGAIVSGRQAAAAIAQALG